MDIIQEKYVDALLLLRTLHSGALSCAPPVTIARSLFSTTSMICDTEYLHSIGQPHRA